MKLLSKRLFLIAAVLLVSATVFAGGSPALKEGFARLPDSARPWVYWFWYERQHNKDGITADLEAMQRVGIGGVLSWR